MAVKGAPTGRKVSGATNTTRSAGKLSGSVASRTALTRRPLGGTKSGTLASLVAGSKKGDS